MRLNILTILGALLVIAGVLAFAGIGIPVDRSEIEIGPIEATVQEERTVPPIVAGILVLAGVGAVVVGQRA